MRRARGLARGVGRRTFLASTAASLAAPAVLRAAPNGLPRVTLKLHHAESAVSCTHAKFLAPWARAIEAQSGGRIRIDIFPSMQLGGQPADLFDQARDRVADIVWAMPSKTPGRFPKAEMFELPFVSARRALVTSRAIQDFADEYLRDEFREVHSLCFSCADRGILHGNRPIRSLSDVTGLRLAVHTSFAAAAVQALGAEPVPMLSAQLPLAVTRRVVDGCIVPWDMVPALKLDDLQKAHTDFADYALSTTTYALAMNKTAYDKLPAELKKVIDANAGPIAAGMAGAMWDLQASAVADAVVKRGEAIIVLEPEAVTRWRKATSAVVDDWRKEMKRRKIDGDKLLANAHSLSDKYASLPEPQPPQPKQASRQQTQAKADINRPQATGLGRAPSQSLSAANSAPPSAAKPSRPAQAANALPPPKSSTRWWEFWKYTPTHPPAKASALAAPAPPPRHWWEFWKSAPAHAPATASTSTVAPSASLPAAPPAGAAAKVAPAVSKTAPSSAAAIVKSAPAVAPPAPASTLDIPL